MNSTTTPTTADFQQDVVAARALAKERQQARRDLDGMIAQGLQGPFLTKEEWRRALIEMHEFIPEAAPRRGRK